MIVHEFRMGGVLISALIPALLLSLLLSRLLARTLIRVGFYRIVWHRPIVDVAITVIIFCSLVWLFSHV